ncbi:MAG: nucleotidyl transferase AbiEii/AbiGii toxin family protein [Campylobacterota bacterium]|nr:nucleotidyl transferase AbiEii/AbiGii toxin family protein [Campylobacterota bacterium]
MSTHNSPLHPAIGKMLEKYDLSTADKTYEALREILQEIVLLGLYRGGFFNEAVFYGGTALRILYGLDRFSEDLDFSLLEPNEDFDLGIYEKSIVQTLQSFGFEVNIQLKNQEGVIKSAFLKGNTAQHLLNIKAPDDVISKYGQGRLVKIKFEVDTQPPINFQSERKTQLLPAPFMIHSMTIPSLFAGKIHAILCRNWSSRPKGRDWYDLVWYIANGYRVDLTHLSERLGQSCDWQEKEGIKIKEDVTEAFVLELLKNRIALLDIQNAKRDIEPFISDAQVLDIWSTEFFLSIVEELRFKI